METAIIFIMLAVCVSFTLKLTFMRLLPCVIEAGIVAAATILCTDFAAEQSKTQIQEWIATPELMLDVAVLLTVDVALQIAFCMSSATGGESLKERILRGILLYVPGVLIFPVMFSCLVELIFEFSGTDFFTVSYSLGAAIFIGFPALAAGMKCLMPEKPVRLELIFYTNCIIAMLGVITTVNGRTAATGSNEINFPALAAIAVLCVAGALAGSMLYNRKNRIKL